jgi:hypothetical protein
MNQSITTEYSLRKCHHQPTDGKVPAPQRKVPHYNIQVQSSTSTPKKRSDGGSGHPTAPAARASARPAAAMAEAPALAGQAADDDVEEGEDAVDDDKDDGRHGVDDAHDEGADGAEDGLDLWWSVVEAEGGWGSTQETTAPMFAEAGLRMCV